MTTTQSFLTSRLIDSALLISIASAAGYAGALIMEQQYLAYYNIYDIAHVSTENIIGVSVSAALIFAILVLPVVLGVQFVYTITRSRTVRAFINVVAIAFAVGLCASALQDGDFSIRRSEHVFRNTLVTLTLLWFMGKVVELLVMLLAKYNQRIRKTVSRLTDGYRSMKSRVAKRKLTFAILLSGIYVTLLVISLASGLGTLAADHNYSTPVFKIENQYYGLIRQYDSYWIAKPYNIKTEQFESGFTVINPSQLKASTNMIMLPIKNERG